MGAAYVAAKSCESMCVLTSALTLACDSKACAGGTSGVSSLA
eukprot:CAMPEP_0206519438 /NCGR_PEP_ID=MMETSP0324_2-20121206/65194_1 /ASSEMBLY_ACC=CAM_ASM_000836 /TAXON_ID=2866 /ORGANISM="Crypthecodinium cohnii, Strain Seligo" /LENGTH=41 /DNA_ID= /DNA_START= /DNA_END= /DNA_ORIENTATION=